MLDAQSLSEIKKIIFRFLDPKKNKVFIFGSRAIGNARKFSDIDIGIRSHKKISEELIEDIQDTFEESDLPYTVDVVDFSQVSDTFKNISLQKVINLN